VGILEAVEELHHSGGIVQPGEAEAAAVVVVHTHQNAAQKVVTLVAVAVQGLVLDHDPIYSLEALGVLEAWVVGAGTVPALQVPVVQLSANQVLGKHLLG